MRQHMDYISDKQTLRGVGVERCPWLDMEATVKARMLCNKKKIHQDCERKMENRCLCLMSPKQNDEEWLMYK